MVKINELRTYYESSGKGKPLILVHGAGGSSGYWGLQLSELSKQLESSHSICLDMGSLSAFSGSQQ